MSLPLHLCQVLEEEYLALYGERPPAETWVLEPYHIRSPERLARRLGGDDALARYLRSLRLDAAALACEGDVLRVRLREGLNLALWSGRLYDGARFREVAIPPDLQHLCALPLEGDDLVHVNRLLLEAAFPDEITPVHEARTAAMYRAIHRRAIATEGPRTALCLSGGGIRSATFGLGVVQGLAHVRVLDRFDYLSTVSGGGYLGGWLSAWIHRHPRGAAGVVVDLTAPLPTSTLRPEPAPVRRFRQYSNYLTPTLRATSIGTWALVGTYVRNLILNWLVVVPILLAVLAVPRVGVSVLVAPPRVAGVDRLLQWAGFACLIAAVAYLATSRPGAAKRGGRARWIHDAGQAGLVLFCVTPLVLSAMLLTAWWNWSGRPTALPFYAFTAGTLHLTAWVIYAAWTRRLRRFDEALVALLTGVVAGSFVWIPASLAKTWVRESELPDFLVCFAVPLFLISVLLAIVLFVGLLSQFTDDDDLDWLAGFVGSVLSVAVGWMLLSTVVLYGPRLLDWLSSRMQAVLVAVSVFSTVVLIGGWTGLGSLVVLGALSGLGTWGKAIVGVVERLSTGRTTSAGIVQHGMTAVTFLAVLLGGVVLTNSLMSALGDVLRESGLPGAGLAARSVGGHRAIVQSSTVAMTLAFVVVALFIGLGMAMVINSNTFSLHAMHRNRLIRAYLGASRVDGRGDPAPRLNRSDNIPMYALRRGLLHRDVLEDVAAFVEVLQRAADAPARALLVRLRPGTRQAIIEHVPPRVPSTSLQEDLVTDLNRLMLDNWFVTEPSFAAVAGLEASAAPWVASQSDELIRVNRQALHDAYPTLIAPPPPLGHGLLHVVNVALNLATAEDPRGPERDVESFTISPLHCGSLDLGYRHSRTYGGAISLGTAMTISGVAGGSGSASPASSVLALIMLFFNVRLGWWLGNPGVYGQRTYQQVFPKPSIKPDLTEAAGLTDDTSQYVNLVDGGRFDNLALFEMIARRCHFIVLVDASADGDCNFEDLANAMRKVRADLGIPISIRGPMRITARNHPSARLTGRYCALADVDYRRVDGPDAVNGMILYIKPCFYGDEPIDVASYAAAHPQFPHEPMADQMLTESQFESYRMLGFHSVKGIWGREEAESMPSLAEMASRAAVYLESAASPPDLIRTLRELLK